MDLASSYLFNGLDENQLKKIHAITTKLSVENGQQIFTEGEEGSEVYVLEAGAVELMTLVDTDFELPVSILRNRGDVFGSSALIPPHQYSLSARCAGNGTLIRVERSALKKLMSEDRDLGSIILANLAKHFFDRLKKTRQELKIHFKTLVRSVHS